MKLQDIRDLSKEDALAAIGLAIKPSTGQWLAGTLSVWALGVVVGAAAALLLAPRSGQELREDLAERVKTVRDRATSRASSAVESAIT
jgi:gas vesicle protein